MSGGSSSRRMVLMALAVEVMEVMYGEGHSVRSALADLGATPAPGRGATWEDVTRRIVTLLEADERGTDLLAEWRLRDVLPEGPLRCVAMAQAAIATMEVPLPKRGRRSGPAPKPRAPKPPSKKLPSPALTRAR